MEEKKRGKQSYRIYLLHYYVYAYNVKKQEYFFQNFHLNPPPFLIKSPKTPFSHLSFKKTWTKFEVYFLPDLATCNFEVKNGCHYIYVLDHSSMDFYWTRGIAKENNTYIEDRSRGSSGENHVVETSEKLLDHQSWKLIKICL